MPRKPADTPQQPPARTRRVRAVADLVPAISGQAFKRFGFAQTAIVQRWTEIVGENYARHSRPESLRFPPGEKTGGTLKIAITGALAPMLRHVEPQVFDRANRVLGHGAVAKLVLRHADIDAPPKPQPPQPPADLGDETRSTLKAIADPDLRASLESLAQALASGKGPPIIR
ncbi:DUF721 domain-containing protein [Sandarakinorhabdus sp.]|uniref:DUF721 domain-containing protein n=1 Tax=Sandarakinorhabdus sp. TaxID=1916663 RepID=UPI00286E40EF|nr:DUF721 domain-containing protein [Sandarakinorhabdus sp.]